MKLKTTCIKNEKEWFNAINRFPVELQDIYFSYRYFKSHEENNEGKALAFFAENNEGDIGFYPFLKTPINLDYFSNGYFDIKSAYGYDGPLFYSPTQSNNFPLTFFESFQHFAQEENILASFTKFHPIIKNHLQCHEFMDVQFNRHTITINLQEPLQDIQAQFKPSCMQQLEQAKNFGLTYRAIKCPTNLDFFLELYQKTMKKVKAREYVLFSPQYFNMLQTANDVYLLNVMHENEIASAALLLIHKNYAHYHLSASHENFLQLRPNNMLIWGLIEFSQLMGAKYLHLGGGATPDPQNGLFKFKQSFSKDKMDFFIGTKIYNQSEYLKLQNSWKEYTGKCETGSQIFFYR